MRGRLFLAVSSFLVLFFCISGTAPAVPRPPRNDNFAEAETIVPPLDNIFAEIRGATTEPGEPTPRALPGGASVWFDWTAEKTGGAMFRACGMEEKALVGVYVGSAVDALAPAPLLLAMRNCEYGFMAVAGVTYRVQVEGGYDPTTGTVATGEVELGLDRFPFNDNFESAMDLHSGTNLGASSYWGSFGATKQPGEPNVGGDPGGASVWFTWTAPTNGAVQVTACDATFPPLLGVFTGSALSELTAIGAGFGEPGVQCNANPAATGQLSFQAVAGTKYDVSVDGRGGSSGEFELLIIMGNGSQPMVSAGQERPSSRIVRYRVDQKTRSATFRLAASPASSTFRCKLDKRRWVTCGTSVVYRHLAFGPHVFRADAIGPEGVTDASAVKKTFKIIRPRSTGRKLKA